MVSTAASRFAIETARRGGLIIVWESDEILGVPVYDRLKLDATLNESHSQSNEVTSHPIEQGGEITDHTVAGPLMLTISGIISNSPIQYFASMRNPTRRAQVLFEKILEFQRLGVTATIFTGLQYYEEMSLLSWEVPRDSQRSGSIWVDLSFKQVQMAESQLVEAPKPKIQKAKASKPQGRKAKSVASEPKKTLLIQLLGS